MNLTIRDADLRDALAIATIQVEASQAAYRHIFPPGSSTIVVQDRILVWEGIITRTECHQRVLVAEASGDICGYVHLGRCRDDDQTLGAGELYSIYVAKTAWRSGIGRSLLQAGTAHLVKAGFETATLWVLAANDRARGFYERYGWWCDGTERSVDVGVTEVRYRTTFGQ